MLKTEFVETLNEFGKKFTEVNQEQEQLKLKTARLDGEFREFLKDLGMNDNFNLVELMKATVRKTQGIDLA